MVRRRDASLILLSALTACGGSRGGPAGGIAAATTAAATTTSASTAAAATTAATALPSFVAEPHPAPERVPLVLVHGIDSEPGDFESFMRAYEHGRPVLRTLYAAEAEALQPGSLAPDVVVAFGYYKETASGPVREDASIGACPVPRTDGLASRYTVSYAERLRRGVDGIRRATGAPRVDLVLHSMGGIVGRAYTRWLSVDASGQSAVRRLFTIASPWRGVNALEATASGFSHSGPLHYRRQGECLELCREAELWGGRSYIDRLNEDWDGFCAAHGVEYAGISLLGVPGAPAGNNPTAPGGIPPKETLSGGGYATGRRWAVQLFLEALGRFSFSDFSELPLLGHALGNLVSQTREALDLGDGVVRLEASRLDRAPFQRAAFFGVYEGGHANLPDPERGFASSFAIDCVRAFCLDSRTPERASCRSLEVEAVRAPGRATWLQVTVDLAAGDGATAVQVMEEPLDSEGNARWGIGYGAPLRPGVQTLAFALVRGGGTRRYRVKVFGPHGPLVMREGLVVTLDDGAIDPAPRAEVGTVRVAPAEGPAGVGVNVQLELGALGAAGQDPALAFRVRVDGGAWSAWSPERTMELALLPGRHHLDVVARSGANGAGRLVEQGTPTGIGLAVDGAGRLTVVH